MDPILIDGFARLAIVIAYFWLGIRHPLWLLAAIAASIYLTPP